MLRLRTVSILCLSVLPAVLLAGCADDSTGPEKTPTSPSIASGTASTLEIMTWNIENFPKNGQTTIDLVADIIDSLDVDLVCVEEIGDTTAFRTLIRSLDGYQGLYSPDTYGDWYQKTGILYRTSIITVGQAIPLFEDDSYAFPRPPMKYSITAKRGENEFDFRLIVFHLKAGDGADNLARRRAASTELRAYLDDRMEYDTEKDYIVAGDWNDEIDDFLLYNAFPEFVTGGEYSFLTLPLTTSDRNASYIPTGALIDHILVSSDVMGEYVLGSTRTERCDDVWAGYQEDVSDHRPVMSSFPVF